MKREFIYHLLVGASTRHKCDIVGGKVQRQPPRLRRRKMTKSTHAGFTNIRRILALQRSVVIEYVN
jgi:hypothetical protein